MRKGDVSQKKGPLLQNQRVISKIRQWRTYKVSGIGDALLLLDVANDLGGSARGGGWRR